MGQAFCLTKMVTLDKINILSGKMHNSTQEGGGDGEEEGEEKGRGRARCLLNDFCLTERIFRNISSFPNLLPFALAPFQESFFCQNAGYAVLVRIMLYPLRNNISSHKTYQQYPRGYTIPVRNTISICGPYHQYLGETSSEPFRNMRYSAFLTDIGNHMY